MCYDDELRYEMVWWRLDEDRLNGNMVNKEMMIEDCSESEE